MKQITKTPMLLLPCAVIVALIGTMTYFACSADDEWEGSPEYLKTHAPMQTRAGVEGGGDDGGFPTRSQILANATVKSHFDQLWEATKSAADSISKREYGCFVFYIFSNGAYSFMDVVGETYAPTAQAHLQWPGLYESQIASLCAMFHTHTTMMYNPVNKERPVGPSSGDSSNSWANLLPSFVYDYVGAYPDNEHPYGSVSGTTSTNYDGRIYEYGQERRTASTADFF